MKDESYHPFSVVNSGGCVVTICEGLIFHGD